MAKWDADGVALCVAYSGQTKPAIVSDGAGGAIVVWRDYRSGSSPDIYAQRITSEGCLGSSPVPVSPWVFAVMSVALGLVAAASVNRRRACKSRPPSKTH
jgi:hypothetical protein